MLSAGEFVSSSMAEAAGEKLNMPYRYCQLLAQWKKGATRIREIVSRHCCYVVVFCLLTTDAHPSHDAVVYESLTPDPKQASRNS